MSLSVSIWTCHSGDVKKNIDVPFMEYQDKNGEPICGQLDYTDLLMAFEEEFDIEIPFEDEEELTTINDVVDYIAAFDKEIEEPY